MNETETVERGPSWESIDDYYRDRFPDGGELHDDATATGFERLRGDWTFGPAVFEIRFYRNGDVIAVRSAERGFMAGTWSDVELLAEGIVDADVVKRALWLDETDDPEHLAIRRDAGDEATTLAWARDRLRIQRVDVPPAGEDRPRYAG